MSGILERSGATDGDLIFFGADRAKVVNDALGALRVKVGQESQFASLASLQVPSSGLTLQTFVSLLRTVFGRQDERIGGEITIKQSDERPSQTVFHIRQERLRPDAVLNHI